MGLVAEQLRQDAGAVSDSLSVDEVFLGLKTIAQTSGKGAIEQKSAGLADLLTHVDSVSAKYVVRIVLGNLRLGIGDATVLDALAKARWNDVKKRKLLEGAYHKTSDLGLIGRTIFEHPDEEEAELAVAALDIQVGKPVHSQLAEQLPLKALVFDILYKDGTSLLDTPLAERLKILEETLHPADDTLMLTASHVVSDAHTLTLLFDEAISKGLEGLVVKKLESRYEAGARNFNDKRPRLHHRQ